MPTHLSMASSSKSNAALAWNVQTFGLEVGFMPTVVAPDDECLLSSIKFRPDEKVFVHPIGGRVASHTVFLKRNQDVVVKSDRLPSSQLDGMHQPVYLYTPAAWSSHSPTMACELRTLHEAVVPVSKDYELMLQSHSDNVYALIPRIDRVTVASLACPTFESHRLHPLKPAERVRFGLGSIVLLTATVSGKERIVMAVAMAPSWLGATEMNLSKWHVILTHMHNNLIRMWHACFVDQRFTLPDYAAIKPYIRGVSSDFPPAITTFYGVYLRPKAVSHLRAERAQVDAAAALRCLAAGGKRGAEEAVGGQASKAHRPT